MTKTLFSLVAILSVSLAACVADPNDDLEHARDNRDDRGDVYEGLDRGDDVPGIREAVHGDLDETLDDAGERPLATVGLTAGPDRLAAAR